MDNALIANDRIIHSLNDLAIRAEKKNPNQTDRHIKQVIPPHNQKACSLVHVLILSKIRNGPTSEDTILVQR